MEAPRFGTERLRLRPQRSATPTDPDDDDDTDLNGRIVGASGNISTLQARRPGYGGKEIVDYEVDTA